MFKLPFSSSSSASRSTAAEDWHRESFGRREATIIAAVCAVGAITLALYTWASRDQRTDSLAATTALGCLVVLVVAIRSARTPYNFLDPLILLSTAFSVYFVFHAFWLETAHSELGIPGSGRPYADALSRSQLYAAGAYGIMIIGYCSFRFRRRRRGPAAAAIRNVSALTLTSIFVFGSALNYAGTQLATTADTTNALLFRTLGYFALLAFTAALIRHALATGHTRRVFGYLAYGFMLPILILSAFSVARGSRTDAVFVILALLSVRTFLVRPVRVRTLVLLTIIILFAVTPTLEALRVTALEESTSVGLVALHRPSHGTLDSTGWELINRRTNGAESLALAVKYSPRVLPYQQGSSWMNVVYTFVPRFLWAGKPAGNVAGDFSTEYGGLSAARGEALTLAPTAPGDLFVNFGLLGLLVGFFVIGVYCRFVTSFAQNDPVSVLWYITLIVPLVLIEESISGSINLLLTRLAASVCFLGFIRLLASRNAEH